MCMPVSALERPHTDSTLDVCNDCHQGVWRARSSPSEPVALCLVCVGARIARGEKVEFGGMSAAQLIDVLNHGN